MSLRKLTSSGCPVPQIGRRPPPLDVSTADPRSRSAPCFRRAAASDKEVPDCEYTDDTGLCSVGTGFAYIARRPRTAEKKLAFMKVRTPASCRCKGMAQ